MPPNRFTLARLPLHLRLQLPLRLPLPLLLPLPLRLPLRLPSPLSPPPSLPLRLPLRLGLRLRFPPGDRTPAPGASAEAAPSRAAEPEKTAAGEAAAREAAAADLPVPGYDDLSVASLRARLRTLNVAQVRDLLAYERAHASRANVITMFERRIAKLEGPEDADTTPG